MKDNARGGNDLAFRCGGAQENRRRGIRVHPALTVIYINDRTRWTIEPARTHITDDTDDGERIQVAVHIAELYDCPMGS
ncbi:MAG: hypothetical protein WBX22_11120 [Silvibacterium sp.]